VTKHDEWLERALQLHERGRLDEAEALYRELLARAPEHAETLHLLGVVQHQRGRYESAIELIGRAIAANGRAARFHNSLGVAYCAVGRFDQAEASYRRALALEPGFVEAMSNLGNVLHRRGDLAGAVALYRRALALEPGNAVFHNNLGTAFADRGEIEEAENSYRRALALSRDYADAHFHLGLVRLLRGDYAAGWREYEWRWRMKSFVTPPREFEQPQWRGEPLDGRRILIHVEQGFGDTLQFVRYVPEVAKRGGRVVLEAPREMMELFAGVDGVAELVRRGPDPPAFAWHCPLMSLPLAFGTELATVPAAVPYIRVDPARAARWRERVAGIGSPKVGVVLAGRRTWKAHYDRALPPEALSLLAGVGSLALVSLQKDPKLEPAAAAVTDLAPELADFADTAAAICALDLVVAADTAAAHLAGALGKPVWILLPHVADWRWLLDRSDSPWYPTARLYRQDRPGDWQKPLERVVAGLRRLAAGDRSVLRPERR
jgi:Flp pilus assembly protein TadD